METSMIIINICQKRPARPTSKAEENNIWPNISHQSANKRLDPISGKRTKREAKQTVQPFRMSYVQHSGVEHQSNGEYDVEGFNSRERGFSTNQTACANAIKRLKAIAAYSSAWTPVEQAHKLEELYIQFWLDSKFTPKSES